MSGSRVAYGAAVWSFTFGVFHVLWVLGWYVGLPKRMSCLAVGLGCVGTAVLALRAGDGFLQTLYLVAAQRYVFELMHLYDFWFCTGAVLFAVSTWRFWRDLSSKAARAAPNMRVQRTHRPLARVVTTIVLSPFEFAALRRLPSLAAQEDLEAPVCGRHDDRWSSTMRMSRES
jgi:hypothetical protein